MNQTSGSEKLGEHKNGRLNGGQQKPSRREHRSRNTKSILAPEASAELRDRLIAELNELGSGDDAAMWAHRCLGEKNKLTAADAQRVEDAFKTRLANLASGEVDPVQDTGATCDITGSESSKDRESGTI